MWLPELGFAEILMTRDSERSDRFLLTHAVQSAKTPYQVDGMNSDHLVPGKTLGQNRQCDTVIAVIECRHQHHLVADKEIRIGRRNPGALKKKRPGHGQFDDVQLPAICSRFTQAFEVFLQDPVIVIAPIRFHSRDHRVNGDKTGDIVHVAMGVVANYAAGQPDHLPDAQVVGNIFS